MSLLCDRYARALFEAARSQDAVDAVTSDLQALDLALADPKTRALGMDPDSPRAVRRTTLEALVEGRHPLISSLVRMLLRRRREKLLCELHEALRQLVLESRGEVEGIVETARTLSAGELRELQAMASRVHGQKVTLQARENPDLIGGVRVRVGTTLYDGSVATALAELERRLLDVPIA